ncbi:MAG: hypothetical protein JXR03_11065 [Cyclobacteriaceae bacterium]
MLKNIFFLFLLFFALASYAASAEPKTSTKEVSQFRVDSLQNQIESLTYTLRLITGKEDSLPETLAYHYFYNQGSITKFSPVSLLIPCFAVIFLVIIISWVWLSKFELKEALTETRVIMVNGTEVKEEIASSSRLIAFVSAAIALILAFILIVTTVYIYLNSGLIPDFEVLVNAVLALGIGVVPYTVNKVAGIFK